MSAKRPPQVEQSLVEPALAVRASGPERLSPQKLSLLDLPLPGSFTIPIKLGGIRMEAFSTGTGLKILYLASDLAEGLLNNTDRPPCSRAQGRLLYPYAADGQWS
jgi:hypothetical protein